MYKNKEKALYLYRPTGDILRPSHGTLTAVVVSKQTFCLLCFSGVGGAEVV